MNAVTPGMTQSETQVQSSSGNYLATRVAGRAIERVQVPADLVGAVMFLSSAASDFMTGQTINVDGGKAIEHDRADQVGGHLNALDGAAGDAGRGIIPDPAYSTVSLWAECRE